MRKLLSLILAALTLFCVCSCAYLSKPDDAVIRQAVEELLPDAYTATYIVYGPGLKLDEAAKAEFDKINAERPYKNAHYIPVDAEQPFHTEKEVRALVRRVFSKDYAEEILQYAFENNDLYMSRYHEYGGLLAMDVVLKAPMDMLDAIFVDTLTVIDGNSYACTAEVEAEQNGERKKVKLQLVYENDRWLFNGPAY